MKYISKIRQKDATSDIISNHGIIKKIIIDDFKMPIGFIIRKELENNDECAKVIFNISLNSYYDEIQTKKFTLGELRYFAIQHLNSIKDYSKLNFVAILNNENNDVEDLMKNSIRNNILNIMYEDLKLRKYVDYRDSNHVYEHMSNFIFNVITNCSKYYKNKKVYVYFCF